MQAHYNSLLNLDVQHFVNDVIPKTKNDNKFLYLNIRSIREKLHDLELLLQSQNQLIHIIAITEIWIYDNEVNYFNIPGYTFLYCTRPTRAGGCAIYVHDSLQCNTIYKKDWNGNNVLGIGVSNGSTRFNVFSIYKKPDSNFGDFMDVLNDIVNRYKRSILLGDFNINLLNYGNDLEVNEYVETLLSAGFMILNKVDRQHTTRISNSVGTIIDHMVTDLITNAYTITLNDTHLTDHRYIAASMSCESSQSHSESIPTITIIDYENINETDLMSITNSTSFDIFNEKLSSLIKTKTKTIIKKNISHTRTPWINSDILEFIKSRDFYYKLKKRYPENTYYNNKFKFYRNKVTYASKLAKKNYLTIQFEQNISDSKKFWALTNRTIFNKSNNKNEVINLHYNNLLITDPFEVANTFNEYFVNVCPAHRSNYDSTKHIASPQSSLYLYKTTSAEVLKIIDSLNSSSANGVDNISVKFLKRFSSNFTEKIADFINNSFSSGNFPECLKIARITPIHKSSNKLDVNNYRPISVLPVCSKIIEKAIQYRLNMFLINNNLINSNQFGFVTNSSTLAACTQLVTIIDTAIDKGLYTGCVFIDLRKAFDSIQHEILFKKLARIGITHNALKLFISYQSGRTQTVQLVGKSSQYMSTHTGVAQGSILSTTLFSIFINDIFQLQLKSKIQLYADDAVLIYENKDLLDLASNMQEDLNVINIWLNENVLRMNTKKTHYIIFEKNRSIDFSTFPDIVVDNQKINRVNSSKYLGLHIDSKLSWREHIKHIKNKINPIMFALRRLKYCIHTKAQWNIYNSYVMSRLLYLNPIWTGASATNLNEISILQNKILRIIHGVSRLHPTIDLYDATILPLEMINKYQLILLIFKIKYGYLKHNFELTYRGDIHNYETRRRSHFDVPRSRTNTGFKNVIARGYRLYNLLPSDIRRIVNISSFKPIVMELIVNKNI